MRTMLLGMAASLLVASAQAEEIWQTLPEPPAMPQPAESGMAPVNDIEMYYAVYGEGDPVLMIHGGLGPGGLLCQAQFGCRTPAPEPDL